MTTPDPLAALEALVTDWRKRVSSCAPMLSVPVCADELAAALVPLRQMGQLVHAALDEHGPALPHRSLREWVRHHIKCAMWMPNQEEALTVQCTCGLNAALAGEESR